MNRSRRRPTQQGKGRDGPAAMPRIFACLAIGQIIVLISTAVFGLLADQVGPTRHVLLAVFTLLLSCLIQVIAFTYLTVTGKMVVQAVFLGGLDPGPIDKARRLKRSWTRLLAIVFASIVLATATGAHEWRTVHRSWFHLFAAGVILLVHLLVLYREYELIVRNATLLEQTLRAYHGPQEAAGTRL